MTLQWIRTADYDAMCREGAARIVVALERRIAGQRPFLLGLATGNTMIGVYRHLADALNRRRRDLSQLHTFNLDEYVGDDERWIPADHPLSYHAYMDRRFFKLLDPALGFDRRHIHFPSAETPPLFDKQIEDMGGLDFQLLGIGFNGHIAFNEPMSEADISAEAFAALPSRIVDLTEQTIAANARLTAAGDRMQVPRRAVTMGMTAILAAREVALLACFPEQAAPLGRIRRETATPEIPASCLIRHPCAAVIYAADAIALEDA